MRISSTVPLPLTHTHSAAVAAATARLWIRFCVDLRFLLFIFQNMYSLCLNWLSSSVQLVPKQTQTTRAHTYLNPVAAHSLSAVCVFFSFSSITIAIIFYKYVRFIYTDTPRVARFAVYFVSFGRSCVCSQWILFQAIKHLFIVLRLAAEYIKVNAADF